MGNQYDKLTFLFSKDKAEINKDYYLETKGLDDCVTHQLDKNIIKCNLGINKIVEKNTDILVSVSGKILAKENNLGLINQSNYQEIFNRLNSSDLIKISDISSNDIQVLACDVTKDIFVEDVKKSLFGISKFLNIVSDKYFVHRHKNLSIFIKPYAQYKKDTLCLYPKYDELVKHNNRKYLDIIGYEYLENCKNIIRIERRLGRFEDIRNAFNIDHKGKIFLSEILESKANPIANIFSKLNLIEEYLK